MTTTALDRPQATARQARTCDGDSPREALASVNKALILLEALHAASEPVGVSSLARETGMPKSTSFRLLTYLEESGFVERSGTAYQLGRRLFELGSAVAHSRPDGLCDIARPHLIDLHARTGMTVHLGVLDGHDVVYLDKVYGLRNSPVPTTIGGRNPASCTALGKAMIAFSPLESIQDFAEGGLASRTQFSARQPGQFVAQLRETRRTAIARDREEIRLGLTCVASPIVVNRVPVAAVSVSAPTRPISAETHAEAVRATAIQISRALSNH